MSTPAGDVAGAFLRHERMIRATVAQFRRRYGGDADDLFSDAQLLFVQVYDKYDPARGAKFGTWFRAVLWNRFISRRRYDKRRQLKGNRVPEEGLPDRRHYAPRARWDHLSAEAIDVIDLVYWPPPDISEELRAARHAPNAYKRLIRRLLRELGWPPGDVNAAFEEIATALKEA